MGDRAPEAPPERTQSWMEEGESRRHAPAFPFARCSLLEPSFPPRPSTEPSPLPPMHCLTCSHLKSVRMQAFCDHRRKDAMAGEGSQAAGPTASVPLPPLLPLLPPNHHHVVSAEHRTAKGDYSSTYAWFFIHSRSQCCLLFGVCTPRSRWLSPEAKAVAPRQPYS